MGVGYPGSGFFEDMGYSIIKILPDETVLEKSEQVEDFKSSLKKLDEYIRLQNELYNQLVDENPKSN